MKHKTALQVLIEDLNISGNIHGVIQAKKYLEYEKNIILMTYISGQVDYKSLSDDNSIKFFNQQFEQ